MGKKQETATRPKYLLARLATAKERIGGTAKSRGFNKRMPPVPDGAVVVYKPYGPDGAGYYFMIEGDC